MPATLRTATLALRVALASTGPMLLPARAKAADPASLRVHVRGMARIDAHVGRSQGKLVLSGTVSDDTGMPAPLVKISVQLSMPSGVPAILASSSPAACGTEVSQASLESADRLVVQADSTGRFCLQLMVPTERYLAHLEARTSGLLDGARIDVPVDLAVAPVTLRVDRPGSDPAALLVLSLDDEALPVDVSASTDDEGISAPARGLGLELSNESGTLLGRATTDATGNARFVVPGPALGPAGRGELRVSFAGTARAGGASTTVQVQRTTRVLLAAPAAANDALPVATTDAETVLHVVARSACSAHGCSATPSGAVEVATGGSGESVLATGPLVGGEARIAVRLPGPAEREDGEAKPVTAELTFRYLPDAPWFEAAGPLALMQPVRPPTHWNRFVIFMTGFLVVGWLGVGRMPRRLGKDVRIKKRPLEPSPSGVEVLKPDSGGGGWRGTVVDGHEGIPLAGVVIAIERGGFDAVQRCAFATSGSDGSFTLPLTDVIPGDLLVAEGPLHVRVSQPVPPRGEIRVALVARRRALLDRLVGWATEHGRPYDIRPEPTPGHVRRVARQNQRDQRDDGVGLWAEAVERAVYSGADVDAATEAEVNRLAPPDAPLVTHTPRREGSRRSPRPGAKPGPR